MSAVTILIILLCYFGMLIAISFYTSRNADNDTFFLGNKKSKWYLVAFGMIGASISGVTFISIPGKVGAGEVPDQLAYMQIALGYTAGYFVIAYVLMPLYYRLNLTSIYTYLGDRFGMASHKTGAGIFIVSRLISSSIRILLVANVLQEFVFSQLGIPFELSLLFSIFMIWVCTFRGGMKTIVITDTIQTFFLLAALIMTIISISSHLGMGVGDIAGEVQNSGYSKMFFFDDFLSRKHFIKQFLAGMFICIGMTGLDQDLMQKNLTCKNIKEAQRNMISFSIVLIFVNMLFLVLGVLLYMYKNSSGMEFNAHPDLFYPTIALNEFSGATSLFFILGLVAASYASADSALTSLTTSVCVDFAGIEKREKEKRERLRKNVHLIMSGVIYITIYIIYKVTDRSAIDTVLTMAAYTYGPLVGLFFYGILTTRQTNEKLVPFIVLLSPTICYIVALNTKTWLGGYEFGSEMLLFNGLLTFAFLYITGSSFRKNAPAPVVH